jgi:FKBP-type peptidyl-prolyl cis-trans isomerase (trigger factor)
MTYTSTIEEINSTRRKFKISVPVDSVKKAFSQATAKVQKTAKVRGFRDGKVPTALVRQFHMNDIAKEAADQVVREAYGDAVKGVDFQIVSHPHIEPENQFEENQDFEFSAIVDINPKVEIKDYKDLHVKLDEGFNTSVDTEVEKLLGSYARVFGKREQVEGEVSSENQDQQDPMTPAALDDELAKKLGYQSLEEATQKLREIVHSTQSRLKADSALEQVIESILEKNDFEVAESLVDNSIDRFIAEENASRPKEQQLDAKDEATRSRYSEEAKKQVRGVLALGHIARQENISVSDDEMYHELSTFAMRNRIDPRAMIKQVGNQIFDEFRGQAMMRKVVEFILDNGHVEYVKSKTEEAEADKKSSVE